MTALLAAPPGMRLPGATRQPRGGWPFALSVLLHVGLLLLAIVAAEHERPFPDFAPPAPFSMVFEGGGRTQPSIANPAPKSRRSGSPEYQSPTPPSPPVAEQAPTAPPRPVPTPEVPAPPARVEPTPSLLPPGQPETQPAPQPPAEIGPAAPTPTAEAPTAPSLPQPKAAQTLPLPPPPVAAPATPARAPAASRGAPQQRQAFAFPSPMDFSLNSHTAQSTSLPHLRRPSPGTIDLSFSPKAGGGEITQLHPYGDTQEVGTDWKNLLSKWWIEHRYYPQEAVRLDQQGVVVLRLMVDRSGHVDSVELEKSSGSPWIDLGALDTLRDANLPPLPKDFTDPKLELMFHLHYILID